MLHFRLGETAGAGAEASRARAPRRRGTQPSRDKEERLRGGDEQVHRRPSFRASAVKAWLNFGDTVPTRKETLRSTACGFVAFAVFRSARCRSIRGRPARASFLVPRGSCPAGGDPRVLLPGCARGVAGCSRDAQWSAAAARGPSPRLYAASLYESGLHAVTSFVRERRRRRALFLLLAVATQTSRDVIHGERERACALGLEVCAAVSSHLMGRVLRERRRREPTQRVFLGIKGVSQRRNVCCLLRFV